MVSRLLQGLEATCLLRSDIQALDAFTGNFYARSSVATEAIYLLIVSLSIEAILHQRILSLFGKICRLDSDEPLNQLGLRQLGTTNSKPYSWFTHGPRMPGWAYPASNATSGDIVTTLASVATVAVAHPTSRRRWLQIAGSTVCHLTLQRGLSQWTQSVLASSLDRRQGDSRQMAEIRKLRVNLQLLKSK